MGSLHGGRDGVADPDHAGDGEKRKGAKITAAGPRVARGSQQKARAGCVFEIGIDPGSHAVPRSNVP